MALPRKLQGWEETLVGLGIALACLVVGAALVAGGLAIGWALVVLAVVNALRAWFEPLNRQSRRMARSTILRDARRRPRHPEEPPEERVG